jgi:hypothetical protein
LRWRATPPSIPVRIARQGGAAPDRNERLYEQVFSPARGGCRCVGDGTSITKDRVHPAVIPGSGSSPRSERRE